MGVQEVRGYRGWGTGDGGTGGEGVQGVGGTRGWGVQGVGGTVGGGRGFRGWGRATTKIIQNYSLQGGWGPNFQNMPVCSLYSSNDNIRV